MQISIIIFLCIILAIHNVYCQFGFGFPQFGGGQSFTFPNQQQFVGNRQDNQNQNTNQQQYPNQFFGNNPYGNQQNNNNPYFGQMYNQMYNRPSYNNYNNYGHTQNNNRPTAPQYTTQNFAVPNARGISATKCKEYSELTKSTAISSTLSLDSVENHRITTHKCDKTTGLIVGGQAAKKGEFPHMALIGFKDFSNEVTFGCGGTLISDKFVITAAHCQRLRGLLASVVRLGEHNRKLDRDGQVDYLIKRFKSHENYNRRTKENDIGLVELNSNVEFTKLIVPACLWQQSVIELPYAIATGWGDQEFAGSGANELMKVTLNLINNQQCQMAHDINIYDSQLCATGNRTSNGYGDTCQGDSGGPLQIQAKNQCIYYIVGVTSTGVGCGMNSPSIYSRVSSYVPWIENIVWP